MWFNKCKGENKWRYYLHKMWLYYKTKGGIKMNISFEAIKEKCETIADVLTLEEQFEIKDRREGGFILK